MAQFRHFGLRAEISEHHCRDCAPAHRHRDAYAAIVLEGAYWETSADGPVLVGAGDIVVHPPFHQHRNRFRENRTRVLNIALPFLGALEAGYRVAGDIDTSQIAALLDGKPDEAAAQLLDCVSSRARRDNRALTRLDYAAQALREDPSIAIAALARRTGYTHAHFTRAFAERYGAPPAAFRAEHRFRAALRRVLDSVPLAEAADRSGYSDQAHMTRDFQRRAGVSPAALRRETGAA